MARSGYKVKEGLVLYYPFDEVDGSVIEDYSSQMRDAQAYDLNLDTSGKFGSGVEYSSIDPSNAMVLLPEGNELGITSGSWSISTWFTYPIEDNGTLFRHALTDAAGSELCCNSKR